MSISEKLKTLFKKKEKKKEKEVKESEILKEWRELQNKLENHPLTQAKIINERLYSTTKEEIDKINRRIEELDTRLTTVERKEFKKEDKSPKFKLSKKEKDVLNVIKDRREGDATIVAEALNVSRSNASLKLNRLYEEGFLEKIREGKNVFYKFKHD